MQSQKLFSLSEKAEEGGVPPCFFVYGFDFSSFTISTIRIQIISHFCNDFHLFVHVAGTRNWLQTI